MSDPKWLEGYLVTVMMDKGRNGNDRNYPYKKWVTHTQKNRKTYVSYKIFPKTQKRQAQKIFDKFMSRDGDDWIPIGGDVEEYHSISEMMDMIRSFVRFYKVLVKF